jgi:hypothetical protein
MAHIKFKDILRSENRTAINSKHEREETQPKEKRPKKKLSGLNNTDSSHNHVQGPSTCTLLSTYHNIPTLLVMGGA